MKKIHLFSVMCLTVLLLSSCGNNPIASSSEPLVSSEAPSSSSSLISSEAPNSSSTPSSEQSSSSEVEKFTVTWKNYDDTILEIDENVELGKTPSYDGATPVKPGNDQYSYTFTNWSPNISPVASDITYTAQFREVTNEYTITWKNYDGSTILTSNVSYGMFPIYHGEIPSKPSTAQYNYTFEGWSPNLVSVTSDATYTALFVETTNKYTITWQDKNNNIYRTDSLDYGAMPDYGSIPTKEGYEFIEWSPKIVPVTEDATYTAVFGEVASLTCKYVASTNSYTVTKIEQKQIVNIPDTYNDGINGTHPITYIDQNAGSANYYLTSLHISSSLISIHPLAFYACAGLSKITVDQSNPALIAIDNSLIETSSKTLVLGCRTSIIPNNGSVTAIGNYAFYQSSISSLVIPKNIVEIKENAFDGVTSLRSLTFEKDSELKTIEAFAFYNCTYLPSLEIPSTVVTIGNNALALCKNITSISIPAGTTSIGVNPFEGCTKLTTVELDENNTTYEMKGNCLIEKATKTLIAGFTTSVIPSDGSVTIIGESAFAYNKEITSMAIPDCVTTLNRAVFLECSSLTNLTLPRDFESFGNQLIYHCDNLKSLSISSDSPTYYSSSNCIIKKANNAIIMTCAGSIIPSSARIIGKNAFSDSSLVAINIPNTIVEIEEWALSNCSKLRTIIIPTSVTKIGGYAFVNNYKLSVYCLATSQPSTWDTHWSNGLYSDSGYYWYSETSNTDKLHWHYVDGVPTVWTD